MPSAPKSNPRTLPKFRKGTGKRPEPRPQLTQEDVDGLAAKMSKAYRWDEPPKDFQLAAVKAQIEGVDMILQAPTGAGKTALAAGPHLWGWKEKKFTMMVCPLLSLEEEMVQTFETDFGLKAVALNSKNGACSPLVIRDILAFKYQIILISPEMLQSRMFTDRVLRNTSFMSHMLSMFIDEAHCVVHWGADFRKKYGTLGKIRVFLPPGTPVIAVTATLTARVRRTLHSSLHFGQSDLPSRFINKGNDRPNVSIVVRACKHPLNTFADLDFIIPSSLRTPSDIPKTYIYVDHIPNGAEIIDRLIKCLETHPDLINNPTVAQCFAGIIRPFNATMSSHYRTLAMAHFRASNIRILVCTDAAGMGCNIPDIDRVVQWKLPATFSHFIQRAGRAARGRGRKRLAVLLVEKSAYNTDLVTKLAPSTGTQDAKAKRQTKSPGIATSGDSDSTKPDRKVVREYARAHGAERGGPNKVDAVPDGAQPLLNPESADEGLLTFVQSTTCRRRVWAKAFESTFSDPVVPCCDICDPTLLNQTHPPALLPERRAKNIKRGVPHQPTRTELRKWRKNTYSLHHSSALYDASAVLDDDTITTLSSCGKLTAEQLSTLLADKWVFWDKHGAELTAFVTHLETPFIPPPPKASKQTPASRTHNVSAAPRKRPILPTADGIPPEAERKRARHQLAPSSSVVGWTADPPAGTMPLNAQPPYAIPPSALLSRTHPPILVPPSHAHRPDIVSSASLAPLLSQSHGGFSEPTAPHVVRMQVHLPPSPSPHPARRLVNNAPHFYPPPSSLLQSGAIYQRAPPSQFRVNPQHEQNLSAVRSQPIPTHQTSHYYEPAQSSPMHPPPPPPNYLSTPQSFMTPIRNRTQQQYPPGGHMSGHTSSRAGLGTSHSVHEVVRHGAESSPPFYIAPEQSRYDPPPTPSPLPSQFGYPPSMISLASRSTTSQSQPSPSLSSDMHHIYSSNGQHYYPQYPSQ